MEKIIEKRIERHIERLILKNRHSSPTHVSFVLTTDNSGKKREMRELVATIDIPVGTCAASYPVEIKRNEYSNFYNGMYTISIEKGNGKIAENIVGDVTVKSLRHSGNGYPPLAMFANEPGIGERENCYLGFPRDCVKNLHIDSIILGHLMTMRTIKKGEPLLWYYGDDYVRDYPISLPAEDGDEENE